MNETLSYAKEPPPPSEEDRSTKKARFREHDNEEADPRVMSFKEKRLQSSQAMEEDLVGKEDDFDVNADDVLIDRNSHIPSIKFSEKVHEALVKPWKSTVVVKLLGRTIGYKALCARL